MKRYLLALLGTALILCSTQAQDLIITQNQDSLKCKITKVTEDDVYFTLRVNGKKLRTQLPAAKLKRCLPGYYVVFNPKHEYHKFR